MGVSNHLVPHLNLSENGSSTIPKMRRSKLGDGCYHVFLDVGANIGVHGRFLFEPEKYPNTKNSTVLFDEYFGRDRDNLDICVFAFEPNPAHSARHRELQEVYGKLGWRYFYEQVAVSDHDGNMTFHHQGDGAQNEWGFSFHSTEGSTHNETVSTIDFKSWVETHIQDRIVPETAHNNNTNFPPTVVMKFDVEGAEYDVIMDLLFSGVLCKTINLAFGESHFWIDVELLNEVVRAFNSRKELCNGNKIVWCDDESYLLDGIPLPDVPQ